MTLAEVPEENKSNGADKDVFEQATDSLTLKASQRVQNNNNKDEFADFEVSDPAVQDASVKNN